jgi:thioredoxin 1
METRTFAEIITGPQPVLVDFFAEWCGPCKMMKPILTDLKEEMGDKVTVIKVDIDKNQEAARMFRINSVPTLVLFKDGDTVWRQSGVVPAAHLKEVIENVL